MRAKNRSEGNDNKSSGGEGLISIKQKWRAITAKHLSIILRGAEDRCALFLEFFFYYKHGKKKKKILYRSKIDKAFSRRILVVKKVDTSADKWKILKESDNNNKAKEFSS